MPIKIRPKKNLGQHFLKDDNIAMKITGSLKNENNYLIEVGPGTGILTKYLIKRNFSNFLAIDIDIESIRYLKHLYPEYEDRFICRNFMDHTFQNQRYSIIGNFPYNISSQLFFKIWDNRDKIDEVVCMVQKEVADRVSAGHGSKTYGILSVLMQAFYRIEYLFTVPPGVFLPPPKVLSSVVRLRRNEVEHLNGNEGLFKKVVKAGFGKRRKKLRNALKSINLPGSVSENEVLNFRAEQLSVEDFISLTTKISLAWKQ